MKNKKYYLGRELILAIAFFLVSFGNGFSQEVTNEAYYTEAEFLSMDKIDVHVHINTKRPDFLEVAVANNFRVLAINTDAFKNVTVREQQDIASFQRKAFPGQVAWLCAFSMEGWNENDWQEKTLAYLKESFAKGAVGVKVWKNIGMDVKDKNGNLIMIDDPKFDPIFDYLEEKGIPLCGHLGEPKNCWLPLDEMTVNNDREYFKKFPEYHMYLHPEFPSYEEQIAARDRLLEKHPDLKFMGAHLGSMEWSVDLLAEHFERFPNMTVDLAERISHLQVQMQDDYQKVRDFFIKYQDRLIYGTDRGDRGEKDTKVFTDRAKEEWRNDWKFFTTDKPVSSWMIDGEVKGLKLPRKVVDKIYYKNAEKLFPEFKKPLSYNDLPKIDAHVHIRTEKPEIMHAAMEENFRFLTICVGASSQQRIDEQRTIAKNVNDKFPQALAYVTTFSMENFEQPGWREEVIAQLKQDFEDGAVGVKVWKDIGMTFRDSLGNFIMIDDPRFDPVLDFIAENDKTLIAHIGEPRNCWLPLDSMTVNNDRIYFEEHPQYHMYLHPDYPSYETLIAARDNMLAKHPNLRVVGAHLGSLEWSVDELATRLDRFPEFAVDMSARICHFQVQDRAKVRDFIVKYQDRLLYATDIGISDKSNMEETIERFRKEWETDWAYFSTGNEMESPHVNGAFNGLDLDENVLKKIYTENAIKWYPGCF